MAVIIRGKNIEITDKLRRYAESKINKIRKHYNQIIKTEVELIAEKNPSITNNQVVEVTLFTKGPVFRGKESSNDIYASIDLVTGKLEKQVEKYKGKTYASQVQTNHPSGLTESPEESFSEQERARIVKTKQFAMKPMSLEEAIMQMETLGHNFFIFTNSETEEINVVYRRRDNNYGLIEPVLG